MWPHEQHQHHLGIWVPPSPAKSETLGLESTVCFDKPSRSSLCKVYLKTTALGSTLYLSFCFLSCSSHCLIDFHIMNLYNKGDKVCFFPSIFNDFCFHSVNEIALQANVKEKFSGCRNVIWKISNLTKFHV